MKRRIDNLLVVSVVLAVGTLWSVQISRSVEPVLLPINDGVGVYQRIDINQADADTLCLLPGIGIRLAERIVAYRHNHGAYTRIEELESVRGIGPRKLAAVRPFVTCRADMINN